jgi:apolipoprotein N-acyltransferase
MNQIIEKIWHSKWSLSLLIGLFLGLSFPPVPLPFLVFPAFFLLFRLVDLSSSAREAAYWAYPGFVLWNIIVTYWLVMATVAGGIAAILANAAVMTVPVMLQYHSQKYFTKWWSIALLQTAFWISYEYLHHQWDLAWPWLTIGNAWSNVPNLVQYISITGYLGISFWIVLTSALSYQAIIRAERKPIMTGVSLLFFPLVSLMMLGLSSAEKPKELQEVVVVQPNLDSYEPNGGFDSAAKATSHLIRLSDSLHTPDTELIVWPENSIQSNITNRDSFGDPTGQTKRRLQNKVLEWDATLLAGATYYEFYSSDNTPALPYYDSNSRPYLPFNAALAFSPDQLDIYRKYNLVPIVERIPFVHFLDAIDLFGWVNWNQIQNYGKGQENNQFSVGSTKTPALICYDSVFPSWVKSFVQEGAGYLTIITNDGWWGNTSGHSQHFAYARLRAVEFNRWVVRSANNGISGIITPDGSVEVRTPYWETTAFRYDVPVLTSQTLYARYGDWLPVGMLVLAFGGIGYIFFNTKNSRKDSM